MLAAAATMWDTLGWGGETQALIWHPELKKVIGINALGVAPTGATPEYFRNLGMLYPPEYGPLAAVTPGTAGGLFTMLAEYGELSLADVLAPAIHMADGYPIEEDAVRAIITHREEIEQWPSSAEVFLPNNGEPPSVGQIFRQPKLAATLRKLVEAETRALAMGASREAAIYAAYDRFYRGDIAQEFVRGSQALGGLHTMEDLDRWQVHIETPVSTNFRGIDVYKLTTWVQGPMMLQALNMLEPMDLAELGYNSPDYIHVLYQVLNHAFADRDFYYGDPYFPPEEPIAGLLSKEYAAARAADISPRNNDPLVQPGDPYPYQGDTNPFLHLLHYWRFTQVSQPEADPETEWVDLANFTDAAARGTTSIQAADANGWLVSITPSGGWIPATIAGDTGIGMSQRMQSFVLDQRQNPFNVLEPGKRRGPHSHPPLR